jgi:hypothetical protein
MPKAADVLTRNYEVRTFNGRLYSRLCQISELQSVCNAPTSAVRFNYEEINDTISVHSHRPPINRLHTIMDRHIASSTMLHSWMMCGDSRDRDLMVPPSGRGVDLGYFEPFENWRAQLKFWQQAELEELEFHYRSLSSRLIAIDDDAWIESASPAIAVTTLPGIPRSRGDTRQVFVFHGVLPPILGPYVETRWFGLDQADEAIEFARRISDPALEVVDLRLPIEYSPAALALRSDETRLWHIGYMLALHCYDSAQHSRQRFDASEHEVIEAAYAEACKTNFVLGTKGIPEEFAERLMSMSGRTKRRSQMTLGLPCDNRLRKLLFEETAELLDDQEITICPQKTFSACHP